MSTIDLTKSILDTISMCSKNAVNNANSVVIVKGEILEEEDSGLNKYRVSYGGNNNLYAYAIGEVKYNPSTIVYMLIPNGDFSTDYIILNAITPSVVQYATEVKEDSFISISGNLFGSVLFKNQKTGKYSSEIQLKSWEDKIYSTLTPEDSEEKDIVITNQGELSNLIAEYLSNYRTFKLSALIKTDIDVNHRGQGLYGLMLSIPIINPITGERKPKIISLTTDNIEGNPYEFLNYQKVDFYFTIEPDFIFDREKFAELSLSAFVQDFKYDNPVMIVDEDGVVSDTEAEPNILIKNLSLEVIEALTSDDVDGFFATLVDKNGGGNYFLSDNDTNVKELEPILKINGKTTSTEDWEYYWFIEDSSINTASQDYVQLGGIGWRCMNRVTNETEDKSGNRIFKYITTDKTYSVKAEDVRVALRYKCSLVKTFTDDEGNTSIQQVDAIILLKNLGSKTSVKIKTITGEDTFATDTGKIGIIARIETDTPRQGTNNSIIDYEVAWTRFDKNGNFIPNEKIDNEGTVINENFYELTNPIHLVEKKENVIVDYSKGTTTTIYCYEIEISISSVLIDEFNTIECTFYKVDNRRIDEGTEVITNDNFRVNLGTDKMVIKISGNIGYTITLYGADVLYKYDTDGDSPFSPSFEGPNTSQEDRITPISFKIFNQNGYEISDVDYKLVNCRWYFPINSLMDPLGIDKNKTDISIMDIPESEKLLLQPTYYIIDNSRSINYEIDAKFNKLKSENNEIRLEVEINGKQFSASANPKFMKDGEGGTNGSRYAAIITYEGYEYGEKDKNGISRKLHMVYCDDKKGWYIHDQLENKLINNDELPLFKVLVYKDGQLMNQGKQDKMDISWAMFDAANVSIKNCFSIYAENEDENNYKYGRLRINDGESGQWTNAENNLCCIIQCEISITTEESTLGISNQEIIRAYYPIEVTWIPEYQKANLMVPCIEGGFDEILYDMDGNNPEYDNTIFNDVDQLDSNHNIIKDSNGNPLKYTYNFKCVNNIGNIESNYLNEKQIYTYKWETGAGDKDEPQSKNLYISSTQDQYALIVPATNRSSNQSNNYIRVDYAWNEEAYNDIKEEITKLEKGLIDNNKDKNILIEGIERAETKKQYYINNKNYIKQLKAEFDKVLSWEDLLKNQNISNSEKIKTKTILGYISNAIDGIFCLDSVLYRLKSIDKTRIRRKIYDINTKYIEGTEILKNAYKYLYLMCGEQDENYLNPNRSNLYNLTRLGLKEDYLDPTDYEKSQLKSSELTELQYYINLWKHEFKRYNKYRLLLSDLNGNKYLYENEFKQIYTFKTKLNDLLNESYYKNLKISPEADFYADRENANQDTLLVDREYTLNYLKTKIELIRDRLITPDFEYYNVTEEDLRESNINKELTALNTYDDFINRFLKPLKDTFDKFYISDDYQEKYYQEIEEKFDSYIDSHKKSRDSYLALQKDQDKAVNFVHIKPIIVLSNAYGLGYLNSWDGNRLYIDEKNQEYILAPTMGAGTKIEGQFTGVVMGIRDFNKQDDTAGKNNQRIGLHGISNGISSFFLNARDGSAVFGKDRIGQVVIDPSQDKALIYSGNYWKSDNIGNDGKPRSYSDDVKTNKGMLIDLTTPYIHFGESEGYIYSGNHKTIGNTENGFYLSQDGLSIGNGFVVYARKTESGEEAGTSHLEQLGSTLAGWKISEYEGNKGLISAYIDEDDEENPGIGIFMDSQTSTIILGSKEGKIYSGKHIGLTSSEKGFYLSNSGFSVASTYYREDYDSTEANPKYIVNSEGKARVFNSKIMLNTSGEPTITTGDHGSIGSDQKGFYLGPNGFSITGEIPVILDYKYNEETKEYDIPIYDYDDLGNVKTSKSKFQINVTKNPVIYSSEHNKLNSPNKGFYIGEDGISIHNAFRVEQVFDQSGGLIEDTYKLSVGNLNTRHWTIGGVLQDYEEVYNYTQEYREPPGDYGIFSKKYTLEKSTFLYDGIFYDVIQEVKKGDYISPIEQPAMVDPNNPHHDPSLPWNPIIIPPNCKGTDGDPEYAYKHKKPKYVLTPTKKTNSYISYGTDNLNVENITYEDLLSKKPYKSLNISGSNGEVYIGTNGFRLGRSFAVDNEGNSTFKGNIEASHGTIAGWNISTEGFYYSFTDEDEIRENTPLDTTIKEKDSEKIDLVYRRVFLLTKKGEVGVSYLYRGDVPITAYYLDGDNHKKDKEFNKNDVISTPLVLAWFGRSYWHGFGYGGDEKGSFDIYANDSHFGGVAIKSGGTYYDTGLDADKAFGSGMKAAVQNAMDMSKYYVIVDGIPHYLQKDSDD